MAQVGLAWDASISPEVTGYKVYWGEQSAVYPNVVDVGNVLTHFVTGLNINQFWYFATTAYSPNGESIFSNELEVFLDFPVSFTQAARLNINLPVNRQLVYNF